MTAKTESIDNAADTIDSRDVIARIEWLEGQEAEDLDDDEREELDALRDLGREAEGYASDWIYGAQLIRDSYFEDYAQELAEDIGAIPDNAQWPCTHIDWERAACELQQDYTQVDFDGVAYWVR